MMGPPQSRNPKLFYVGVNLEQRVDPDHPLRKIAAAVDFGFVRPLVADLYGVRGNPSLDPALVLKLLFLLFYENISSERQLLRQLPQRLDWLWFLEMDLDSPIPDHSVLSKARRRWGPKVFTDFFKQILRQCVQAGLVDGARVHVDGSVIAANADQDKLTLALELVGQEFYGKLEADGQPLAPAPSPESPASSAVSSSSGPPGQTPPETSSMPVPPALVPPGTLYCPTDPEARLTQKGGVNILGYKDHRVVDDQCGIITASLTTAATVAEASMLQRAMDTHEENTGLRIVEPTADRGYGTVEVYRMLQARGCLPCIPHPAVREDKSKFPRSLFIYDPRQDVYRCPAGQTLHRRGVAFDGRYRYQTQGRICEACSVRGQCTASSTVRVLSRQVHQEAIDWADHCLSQAQRRIRMRRRKIRAEGSFADASNRHGYKRARWRGLAGMTNQNLLIASIQNVRKLVRYGHRRPPGSARRLATYASALSPITPKRHRWPGDRHRNHIQNNGQCKR